MKKLFKEFAEFINKGNALALTIGIILGSAFSGIVNAVNEKVVSPLISLAMGKEHDLSQVFVIPLAYGVDPETGEQVITNAIYFGALIQAVLDFLIIAVVLFIIFKVVANVKYSAKKTAEILQDCFDGDDEVKEEAKEEVESTPVVEPAPAPVVSDEVLLLTEIRDLLKESKEENKE